MLLRSHLARTSLKCSRSFAGFHHLSRQRKSHTHSGSFLHSFAEFCWWYNHRMGSVQSLGCICWRRFYSNHIKCANDSLSRESKTSIRRMSYICWWYCYLSHLFRTPGRDVRRLQAFGRSRSSRVDCICPLSSRHCRTICSIPWPTSGFYHAWLVGDLYLDPLLSWVVMLDLDAILGASESLVVLGYSRWLPCIKCTLIRGERSTLLIWICFFGFIYVICRQY